MFFKRIKKLFPDVINYNIIDDISKIFVELETIEVWNEKSAMAFQVLILDKNPIVCGGPFDFICEKKDISYIVKWNCYNISGW